MTRRPRRRSGARDDRPAEDARPGPGSADADAEVAAADGTEVDLRKPIVGVVMGSDSDLPVVQHCLDTLEEFDIPYEAQVLSAHRTPEQAHAYASTARLKGMKVLIAAAGGAAHLAGVLASLTTLPVIGIPIQTETLGGADSLYSTVQMPAGVPVATVAIGKGGAKNAALLAAEILALYDEGLHHKLQQFRASLRQSVAKKNERLREQLSGRP
jgi:phosphoribosylaminoimidazole carboxylase PurE protein